MPQFRHHGATVLPENLENCPQTAGRVSSSPKALGELSILGGALSSMCIPPALRSSGRSYASSCQVCLLKHHPSRVDRQPQWRYARTLDLSMYGSAVAIVACLKVYHLPTWIPRHSHQWVAEALTLDGSRGTLISGQPRHFHLS